MRGLVRLALALVLIVGGVWLLWKRPTYSAKEEILRLGDIKATVDSPKAIPPWIGVVAVGAGVVLLVLGRRRA